MCKIINQKGEVFRIDAAYFYAQKQLYKGAPAETHTFEVRNISIETVLGLPEFAGFREFTDEWAFETKYRYFVSNAEIGVVAKVDPTAYNILAQLRRVDFENGTELYFDYIEEWFSPYINLNKLELNNDLV